MMGWNWFTRNGIRFISREEWLNEGVNAAFSIRTGGVSRGVYNSLNMGLHVGDEDKLVLENRQRYLQIFSANLEDAVCCQQVHGNNVILVERNDRGKGAVSLSSSIANYDAMITNIPDLYLLSFYADCVPVYFYDPANRAIGIAHGGWKGTMGKIAVNTLQAMQRQFNTEAAEVQIFIGPGIGSCCFEIQADLMGKVNAELSNLHDIINSKNGTFTWDLQETNRQLLEGAGVNPLHISVCKLCTCCNTEMFYSYRKEKGETGRMGAVIGLEY